MGRGGAYGFAITGLVGVADQMVTAPPHWPSLRVVVEQGDPQDQAVEHVDETVAQLRLRAGGSVLVERSPSRATFRLSTAPLPGALLHPHLSSVAAVASHWRGREAFHAGGFVAAGRVWGVLGEKTSGKSSLLALLAGSGAAVLTDDLLVLDGSTAFAGPRSIDLRPEAAKALGTGQQLGVIGDRERWRLSLPPIEPELPLAGWITLRWGDGISVRPRRGAERLTELLAHRALRIPPRDGRLALRLAALPLLELTRPKRWNSAPAVMRCLLQATSG